MFPRGLAVALQLFIGSEALHVSTRARLESTTRALDVDAAQRWTDVSMPFCVFGQQGSLNGTVQVYLTADNTRSLSFGSDDFATQTQTKCKGEIPVTCREGRATKLANVQSCDSLSCPCDPDNSNLDFPEFTRMMDIAVPMCQYARNGDFKSLLVGLGGGAIPEYLLEKCPKGSAIESVEFDPRVVQAATNFFGLSLVPGINEVENNDGGQALQDRAADGKSYDVVMVDAFVPGGVPESCRSEALAQNVHKVLKPGGKFIQHIWHNQLDSTVARYRAVFGNNSVVAQDAQLGVSWLIVSTMSSDDAPPQ